MPFTCLTMTINSTSNNLVVGGLINVNSWLCLNFGIFLTHICSTEVLVC